MSPTSAPASGAELLRLRGYALRAVVIEGTLAEVVAHAYTSRCLPQSVIGSVAAWTYRYGISFNWCHSPQGAATLTLALLRAYHRQLCELLASAGYVPRKE